MYNRTSLGKYRQAVYGSRLRGDRNYCKVSYVIKYNDAVDCRLETRVLVVGGELLFDEYNFRDHIITEVDNPATTV